MVVNRLLKLSIFINTSNKAINIENIQEFRKLPNKIGELLTSYTRGFKKKVQDKKYRCLIPNIETAFLLLNVHTSNIRDWVLGRKKSIRVIFREWAEICSPNVKRYTLKIADFYYQELHHLFFRTY